jgi:hypothetical protein
MSLDRDQRLSLGSSRDPLSDASVNRALGAVAASNVHTVEGPEPVRDRSPQTAEWIDATNHWPFPMGSGMELKIMRPNDPKAGLLGRVAHVWRLRN